MIINLHNISIKYLHWEKPKTAKEVVLVALKALSYLTIFLPLAALAIIKIADKRVTRLNPTNLASEKTLAFFPSFLQLNIRETCYTTNLALSDLSKDVRDSMEYKIVPDGPILFLKLKIRFQKINETAKRSMKDTYQLPSTEVEQELRVCVHPDLPHNPHSLKLLAPHQAANHRGEVFTLDQIFNSFSDTSSCLEIDREVQTDFNLRWLLARLVKNQSVQLIEQTHPLENFTDIKGLWHVRLA